MTSATDAKLILFLNFISQHLNEYLSPIIFIFCIVGSILNCLVLSQRTLRSNSCATVFLVSSFVDLISILSGLSTRILAGWNLDLSTTIRWIYKLRTFIVFSTRTMAIWLIALATIDRWLLSCINIHHRHMSTLKNTKRAILATIIFSIISYIHMLYCYKANLVDTPLQCYGKSQECRLATDLIYAIITIVIPSILMIISNIRYLRMHIPAKAIISIVNSSREKELKLRKTLLRMLFLPVILLIIFCIPQALQKFYITFEPFGSVSKYQDAVNAFLYNIVILLAPIASGMLFYLYT